MSLTELETLRILLLQGEKMEGKIWARGKCPLCKNKFVEIPGCRLFHYSV